MASRSASRGHRALIGGHLVVVDRRAVTGPISAILKKLPEWAMNALKTWFQFFWRLGAVGKIIATVIEMISLVLVTSSVHLNADTRHSIVQIGGITLMLLLVFGILVGRPNAK